MRHGPQLSIDSSLLLHQLLQLQGDKSSRLMSPTLQMLSGYSASVCTGKKIIHPPKLHSEPCPAQLVRTLVPSCCRYCSRCWTSWTQRRRSAWSCVLSASSRLTTSALALPPAGASARVLSESDRHKHMESEADVRRKAGVPHSSSLLSVGAQVKTFLCSNSPHVLICRSPAKKPSHAFYLETTRARLLPQVLDATDRSLRILCRELLFVNLRHQVLKKRAIK